MIKLAKGNADSIIGSIPKNYKIIDIGGGRAPFRRANYVIDIAPYEELKSNSMKGSGEKMFSRETYIVRDLCEIKKYPFPDKYFDYSICSHVLEDIRDPLWVCSELMRISKAGYIEVPSVLYETSFGLEAKKLAGASHHRWLIDLYENKLRFTFKHFYVHSKAVNKNIKKVNLKNDNMYLRLEWKDSFEYAENWLNNGKEVFEYFASRKITNKEMWKIYRKIGPRNIIIKWLAYLKNTSNIFGNIYSKLFIKK